MKNVTLISIFSFLVIFNVLGQETDVKSSLASAKSDYSDGNLSDARFTLQQTLNELNNVIGEEIRAMLPDKMDDLPVYNLEEETIGNAGSAGIFINRTYKTDSTKIVEVTITDHSPMIAMVNTFLSNPLLTGLMAAETGQKVVKVHGYKGMLEKAERDDGVESYNINIPFGDSLMTFETEGVKSESVALAMAETVPLDKIAKLVK